uniref:Uncharacterized protein n=1 Tax=Magallana gigas TaxID=29159 RepID=A0A8W8MQ37_MAGGI
MTEIAIPKHDSGGQRSVITTLTMTHPSWPTYSLCENKPRLIVDPKAFFVVIIIDLSKRIHVDRSGFYVM